VKKDICKDLASVTKESEVKNQPFPKWKRITEHDEQTAVFKWRDLNLKKYPELISLAAIPNGGHRHKAVAGKLKAEGVSAGFPDIILTCPRHGYHGLFIEMKVRKGGRVSPEQKEWLDRLRREGYQALVCHGFEEARDALRKYLFEEEKIIPL
jgi:hypothetical protein